jgi:hypothetical protein
LQEVVVVARLRVLVGAILAAALVLAFAVPASAHAGGTAKVRAFHDSPDAPAVDVQAKLLGTSYTAWAVGFLTPTGSYPGFGMFVSVDG